MRFILKVIRFVIYRIANLYNILYNKIIFFREKVNIKNYRISGRVFVRNKGEIEIGKYFKANSGSNYNPIGGDTILRLICHKNAKLSIGNNVGMSNSTFVCSKRIIIGDNVMIGGGCKFWDTDFHSLDSNVRGTSKDFKSAGKAAIHIKKNAFIGGGTTILKGVTIGENSIVAAGSVVSKSIPDNEVWGGNPTKFIRKL